jgi:hypothetical protein
MMGEPVLSQKNLASHNQQLQQMNPATQREMNHGGVSNDLRAIKKRGGASTDMVPQKQKRGPLTGIRTKPPQYESSP